jgi:hypothetical protein
MPECPKCDMAKHVPDRWCDTVVCIWKGTWRERGCDAPACPVHGRFRVVRRATKWVDATGRED